MAHHQILIVGGGAAGITVAAQLKRALLPRPWLVRPWFLVKSGLRRAGVRFG